MHKSTEINIANTLEHLLVIIFSKDQLNHYQISRQTISWQTVAAI